MRVPMLLLSLLISGCSLNPWAKKEEPKQAEVVKPVPADEIHVEISGDYRSVYKKTLPYMRGCNTGRISHLDALLVKDDNGFGEIKMNGTLGPVVTARFSEGEAENQTRLTVKFASLTWQPVAQTVVRWAQGQEKICPKFF
ncbi:hypothetical protein [Balneatrix alpica]|uniref:Lipoprotein n=1 Tax=Balneatrix alpica TaxID=75684 RepID=A0ABV5Z9M7_9GAMM|nr:hypothetical protein [Balneatrix alpica]